MNQPYYTDDLVTVHAGDCIDVMRRMPDCSVHAIVTDPPYGLEFMGKKWDSPWRDPSTGRGVRGAKARATEMTPKGRGHTSSKGPYLASRIDSIRAAGSRYQEWCVTWATECHRVMKPGAFLLAFGGSRTWHRLAAAIEDAALEIRDSIAWLYASGFPKSLDVASAINKRTRADHNAAEWDAPGPPEAKQWDGWGTALKPSFEPIVVARRPLDGTVAANVLQHSTGALNIASCRVAFASDADKAETSTKNQHADFGTAAGGNRVYGDYSMVERANYDAAGRWPPNVLLDESQARALDEQTRMTRSRIGRPRSAAPGAGWGMTTTGTEYDDAGGAARFFPTFHFEAKAGSDERPTIGAMQHPTVKPLSLMRWLVRLVTPPRGVVLDPFSGSGTTAEACVIEGFRCIAIEREPEYLPLIVARLTKPLEPVLDFDDQTPPDS
jgi:site-specific DNA-methyltransferase (adenine-specific)